MINLAAYGSLFMAAFLAATLIPAQSESVLTGLMLAGGQPVVALVAVASLGNILGSVINWLIGRGVERFRDRRWFPASARQLERAQAQYRRFGYWSLLLAWVPIIGDPLTLVAGIMREPLWRFLDSGLDRQDRALRGAGSRGRRVRIKRLGRGRGIWQYPRSSALAPQVSAHVVSPDAHPDLPVDRRTRHPVFRPAASRPGGRHGAVVRLAGPPRIGARDGRRCGRYAVEKPLACCSCPPAWG
jgi:membrane protein YqaA with SNARE-associated domain